MPHRPGHNRFGSSTGTTGGPAGMGSPPPSQNFGSNVVIGGNPGDAGGSTSGPPRGPVLMIKQIYLLIQRQVSLE